MNRGTETAQRSSNSEGPVMGGINLAAYQVEIIPQRIQFSAEELRPVKWALHEQEGNSVELRAEPARPCSLPQCR